MSSTMELQRSSTDSIKRSVTRAPVCANASTISGSRTASPSPSVSACSPVSVGDGVGVAKEREEENTGS